MKKYAIYIRVSTKKQGASGLGLEAQREMCYRFIADNGGECDKEFCDVESGKSRTRKGLFDAITFCKENSVPLVIAKLDRLARDVEFCFKVINTGIEIHFVDMPQINTLLLGVFASVAQYERELTSDRTTKALHAKKARGEKTGGACEAWRKSYESKSEERKAKESAMRGKLKNARHVESKDVKAFLKVLKNVFPEYTQSPFINRWDWEHITTRSFYKERILSLMRDYKEIDNTLFARWDFEAIGERKTNVKLACYINSVRKSFETYYNNK